MPQMAPMNWLFLYFFFTCIFIIFNMLNYYLYMIKNNYYSMKNKFNKKNLTWKW
uniref:ATP synthase complex subunit 8 n=2 Tax=Nebria brevicollis TaxID=110024 RepID=A0A191ZRT6_NEBBR|nr:ATP synthase F0 subunit 8 [Nebria brevicollis]